MKEKRKQRINKYRTTEVEVQGKHSERENTKIQEELISSEVDVQSKHSEGENTREEMISTEVDVQGIENEGGEKAESTEEICSTNYSRNLQQHRPVPSML